jgi:hypothetical protein
MQRKDHIQEGVRGARAEGPIFGLFTRVRGRVILGSSPLGGSPKFAVMDGSLILLLRSFKGGAVRGKIHRRFITLGLNAPSHLM